MVKLTEDGKPVVAEQMVHSAPKPRHRGDASPVQIAGGGGVFNPIVGRRYWLAWDAAGLWFQQYDGPGAAWRTPLTPVGPIQVNFYQEHDPTVPEDGAYRLWNNPAGAQWIAVSWEVDP